MSGSSSTLPPATARRIIPYINLPLEILILILTLIPILILIYLYPALPERVSVFVNLRGEVQTWAQKSVISVFRLPAMGIAIHVLCLLMKYGPLQSRVVLPREHAEDYVRYKEEALKINMRLWDWIRLLVAVKWVGASLDVVFLGFEGWHPLSTAYTITSLVATVLAIAAALYCGYRLLNIKRRVKEVFSSQQLQERVNAAHVYGGIFYYNSDDPALFVNKHILNFGNRWSYLFIGCIVAYPLLTFMPLIIA